MCVSRSWETWSWYPDNHAIKSACPHVAHVMLLRNISTGCEPRRHQFESSVVSNAFTQFRGGITGRTPHLPKVRRQIDKPPIFSQNLFRYRVGRPEIYRVKLLIEQTVKSFTSRVGQLTEKESHYFSRLLRLLTDIHVEEYHYEHKEHQAEDVGSRLTCGKSLSPVFLS